MEKNILDNLTHLPNWMAFVIVALIIVVPFVSEIIRQVKNRGLINMLTDNQLEVNKNFNLLLDVLYEKYANNLTLEVSKHVIDLVYSRQMNTIKDRLQNYVHNKDYVVDGKVKIEAVKNDIGMLISNIYYQDIMILNKMTFQSYKLSLPLQNIKYQEIIDKSVSLLNIYDLKDCARACINISKDLEAYYTRLINKSKAYLEELQ